MGRPCCCCYLKIGCLAQHTPFSLPLLCVYCCWHVHHAFLYTCGRRKEITRFPPGWYLHKIGMVGPKQARPWRLDIVVVHSSCCLVSVCTLTWVCKHRLSTWARVTAWFLSSTCCVVTIRSSYCDLSLLMVVFFFVWKVANTTISTETKQVNTWRISML